MMTRLEIEHLINEKIIAHERRIGWISSIMGIVFILVLSLLK
jgi:hypothetical protein